MRNAWGEEGYHIYAEEKPFGRIKIKEKLKAGNQNKSDTFLVLEEDIFLFVGVSSNRVFNLRKAANSLALQKDRARIEQLAVLRKRIECFFEGLDL